MVKKKKRKAAKKAPPIRLKIVGAKPKVKAVRIPTYLASAQDIVKSAEREERIKRERRERIREQLQETKKFVGKVAERVVSKAERWGKKKAVSKPILKRSKTTIVVKEQEQAHYVSRFFKR